MTLATAAAASSDMDQDVGPAALPADRLDHEEIEGDEDQVPERDHQRGPLVYRERIETKVHSRKAPSSHSWRVMMTGRRLTVHSRSQAATARAPIPLSMVRMPAP